MKTMIAAVDNRAQATANLGLQIHGVDLTADETCHL